MKNGGPPRSWNAAASAASTGSTSKKRPNTALSASSDVAMPPLVRKNSRRFSPSRGASRPAAARIACSTRCCSAVWGRGGNSSLETSRVGMGVSVLSPWRMPGRTRNAWGLPLVMLASRCDHSAPMDKRARVMAALRGEAVDRVPLSFWLHNFATENAVDSFVAETLRLARTFDWDYLKPQSRAQCFAEAWGFRFEGSG